MKKGKLLNTNRFANNHEEYGEDISERWNRVRMAMFWGMEKWMTVLR